MSENHRLSELNQRKAQQCYHWLLRPGWCHWITFKDPDTGKNVSFDNANSLEDVSEFFLRLQNHGFEIEMDLRIPPLRS